MSDHEPYVERTVVEGPAVVRREIVRTRGGSAGWWMAALVAVLAVVALLFLFNRTPSDSQLQAAQDQGRTQAAADAAAIQAQTAAQSAQISASTASAHAADSMTQASRAAAQAAGAQAARTASDVATDASDTAASPPPATSDENPR